MTTPTPRDTGPALDPRAVEAAAEAIRAHWGGSDYFVNDLSTRALTAAAPFLRAEGAAAAQAEVAAVWRFAANEVRIKRDLIARDKQTAADALSDLGALFARIAEADPGTTAPTEEAP